MFCRLCIMPESEEVIDIVCDHATGGDKEEGYKIHVRLARDLDKDGKYGQI